MSKTPPATPRPVEEIAAQARRFSEMESSAGFIVDSVWLRIQLANIADELSAFAASPSPVRYCERCGHDSNPATHDMEASAQTQAFVDRCHELGAVDTDIVKHALEDQERLRGVGMELAKLRQLATEFVAYWTTDRAYGGPDVGCGMCGGITHSSTCYVGRMHAMLAKDVEEADGR